VAWPWLWGPWFSAPRHHFLRSWTSNKAELSGPRTHRPKRSYPAGSTSQHLAPGTCRAAGVLLSTRPFPPLLQRSLSGRGPEGEIAALLS
jgi:hypothetical protein